MTISVTLCASICTPKTDLDGKIAFICDTDVPSIFHRPALLYVHLSQDSNLSDNSNRVNCPHLLKVVDFLDCSEAEAAILNWGVIVDLLYFRLLIEDNRIIIFDASILLIGHFNLSISKEIDTILNQPILVVVSLVIEEGCLDLSALVVN